MRTPVGNPKPILPRDQPSFRWRGILAHETMQLMKNRESRTFLSNGGVSEKASIRWKQLCPHFIGLIKWPLFECSVVMKCRLRCYYCSSSAKIIFGAPQQLALELMPILVLHGVFSGEKAESRDT